MPSYAILGATGNTGQSILKVLQNASSSPDKNDIKIHAYCRSKQKLLTQLPTLKSDSRVQIFEGALSDTPLLASCLSNTHAAFLTVAKSGNTPGLHIAQDTAQAVISALEHLRANDPTANLPRLIVLSSASLDHRFMSSAPKFLLNILYRAFSYIYDDLRKAETFLRSNDHLTSSVFVRSGAISDAEQPAQDQKKGHFLSEEYAKSPVSYADLAAGMVEIALDAGDRYDGKGVAVNSRGKVPFPWKAPPRLLAGLVIHFFPWTYRFLG